MRTVLLLLIISCAQNLFAQRTILHCGQLIDVKGGVVLKEMSVIIEGDKITDVVKGYLAASGSDKLINLRTRTVMPGLIDAHVHLETETNPNEYSQRYTLNPSDYA